ncbi:MAG: hypothetical protein Q9164_004889, partial [Protoblastenia rupestris]
MFAVPGWSVSASSLKTQVEPKGNKAPSNATQNGERDGASEKKSRKRKRGSNGVEVTKENVGDLWKKYVEVKSSVENGVGKVNGDEYEHPGGGSKVENKKKRKRKIKEAAKNDTTDQEPAENLEGPNAVAESTQAATNANLHAPQDPPPIEEALQSAQERTKARYEQRKDDYERKRKKKARLQADGSLPPTRPPLSNQVSRISCNKGPVDEAMEHVPIEAQKSSPEMLAARKSPPPHQPQERASPTTTTTTIAPKPSTTQPRLTPLQQKMASKLTSARFRHLNETLYTSPSTSALALFTKTPGAYTSYHHGFRAQVSTWPSNPLSGFISDLKTRSIITLPTQKQLLKQQRRAKTTALRGSKGKNITNGNNASGQRLDILPRSPSGICRIIDLGCGDAHLAASFPPSNHPNLSIRSFDMSTGDGPNTNLIEIADITNLRAVGIADASIDIAICCLSLMSTNWVQVVDEVGRAVREGGECWVAEIKSRFGRPRPRVKKLAGDKMGKLGGNKGNKGGKRKRNDDDDNNDDMEQAVALEELEEDTKSKEEDNNNNKMTDVSAFVNVFRKRGFVVKGEVDVGNKMFVKM